MKRPAIIFLAIAAVVLVALAIGSREPRIRIKPNESPARAVQRIAAGLSEERADEFREAANRLQVHAAANNPDNKLQAAADQLNGKTVSEVIAAYWNLPKAEREAANQILQFDGQ